MPCEDVVALAAHVDAEDAIVSCDDGKEGGKLPPVGRDARLVVEAGGEAEAALAEALVEEGAHGTDLLIGGSAVEVGAHDGQAQRGVGLEEGHIVVQAHGLET